MSTKTAKTSEAPVELWEAFEGQTYGYSESGARVVEITARTRPNAWNGHSDSNLRGWAVMDEDNNIVGHGQADGLRAAKRDALAALRTHHTAQAAYKPLTVRLAPNKGTSVQVNDTYPTATFRGARGKVESSGRGDDGEMYVTVNLGTESWPFKIHELDVV